MRWLGMVRFRSPGKTPQAHRRLIFCVAETFLLERLVLGRLDPSRRDQVADVAFDRHVLGPLEEAPCHRGEFGPFEECLIGALLLDEEQQLSPQRSIRFPAPEHGTGVTPFRASSSTARQDIRQLVGSHVHDAEHPRAEDATLSRMPTPTGAVPSARTRSPAFVWLASDHGMCARGIVSDVELQGGDVKLSIAMPGRPRPDVFAGTGSSRTRERPHVLVDLVERGLKHFDGSPGTASSEAYLLGELSCGSISSGLRAWTE